MGNFYNPYRSFLFYIGLIFSVSGCFVKETGPDCPPIPPVSKVVLSPVYTKHNFPNQDLFGDCARRVDIYLFNGEEVFVTKYTDASFPFSNGYSKRLDNLPIGRYKAVVWINDLEEIISPQELIPNITRLNDLTLSLRQVDSLRITDKLKPLLWGETEFFDVTEKRKCDLVIPVNLTLDTKIIQVIITWHDKNTGQLSTDGKAIRSLKVYLEDDNGILDFKNMKSQCPWLTYIPEYQLIQASTGGAVPSDNKNSLLLKTEFTMLRLFIGSSTQLLINKIGQDGAEYQVVKHNLMRYLHKVYRTQESLDRQESFVIELELDGSSPKADEGWTVLAIKVNGWTIVDNGEIEI